MLDYKRFLFFLNKSECVFTEKKLHKKNNTAMAHVAFFNHLHLQHQLKRFNSQNPLGLKRVPLVTFLKNKMLFFVELKEYYFFFFVNVKSIRLLMRQSNL